MNFLKWIAGLSDAEKSLVDRPTGMSRRSFLAALGITAVTVMLPSGLLVSERKVICRNYVFDEKMFAAMIEELSRQNRFEEMIRSTAGWRLFNRTEESVGENRFAELVRSGAPRIGENVCVVSRLVLSH